MPLVVLDLGHTGGTHGRPGAEFGGRRETSIVRRYAIEAADRLEAAGCVVDLAGQGTYGRRQRHAALDHARAWVSCHVNAGWRDGYGPSVYFERGGLGGSQLAGHVAAAMIAEMGRCRTWAASQDDWTRRAHSLIAQTGRVPAIVFEPAFIDGPADHLDLLDDPSRLGVLLSAGILEFLGIT